MSTPADVPAVPEAPQKPQKQRKPPSPHIPRLFAALAIITLLAVPVVVPVVVMKMTGKTGRKDRALADAIEGPEVSTLIVTAPEETTQEEIQESFLKLNDNKVSPQSRGGAARNPLHTTSGHQPPHPVLLQQPASNRRTRGRWGA